MSDQVTLNQSDLARLQELLDQAGFESGAPAQQGADTFAADAGQIVAPDGSVTYDFDAHIHARGLDLDAGDTSAPPNDRKIRWLRQSDGSVVADLRSYASPTSLVGELHANPGSGRESWIGTGYDAPSDTAQNYVATDATTGGGSRLVKVLLDHRGASDYMQLPARGAIAIDFGTSALTFANSTVSAVTSVGHRLGRVPIAVLATAQCVIGYSGNASSIGFQGVWSTNLVATLPFSWIAIG